MLRRVMASAVLAACLLESSGVAQASGLLFSVERPQFVASALGSPSPLETLREALQARGFFAGAPVGTQGARPMMHPPSLRIRHHQLIRDPRPNVSHARLARTFPKVAIAGRTPRLAPPGSPRMAHPDTQLGHHREPGHGTRFSTLGGRKMNAQAMGANAMAGAPAPSTTGLKAWETYVSHRIPGVGVALADVANGNVVVEVADADLPERGIDLSFTRYFNSQSQHDALNSDGTIPSPWGNGWSSTYDAHIVNPNGGFVSVYDATGGRWDYQCPSIGSSGACTPQTTGDHSALNLDPNNACNYAWTHPDGSVDEFWSPAPARSCGVGAAYDGRLARIYARNHNNYLDVAYGWASGDDSVASNLAQITVTHSGPDGLTSGQQLILKFAGGAPGSISPTELSSVTLPSGRHLSYSYDGYGNLLEVDHPGNNVATRLPETYVLYPSSDNSMLTPKYQYVCSPRYGLGTVNSDATSSDGGCTKFDFGSSNRIADIFDAGVVNFTPAGAPGIPAGSSDTTGQALQPSMPTGWMRLNQTWFVYGVDNSQSPNCDDTAAGTTTVCDSDDHETQYAFNSRGLVSQISWATTGSGKNAEWIAVLQGWDSQNNLLSTTDAASNETDYLYDQNGNAVEILQPTVPTASGNVRPTTLLTRDSLGNVSAYCDPVQTLSQHVASPFMGTPPPNSPIPSCTAGTILTWTPTNAEPNGKLTRLQSPSGYRWTLGYDVANQGGSVDFGLPTSVAGDATDDAGRTPKIIAKYDLNGNATSYDTGNGHPYSLILNTDNQVTAVNAPAPSGDTAQVCYYPDGSIKYTETPYQYVKDGSSACQNSPPQYAVSYTYDGDGNSTTETHHHGGAYGSPLSSTENVTARYFDGLDRLVEVIEPRDSSDVYVNPWITRYIFDMTGYVAGSSNTFTAYAGSVQDVAANGNLLKTQELLPTGAAKQKYSGPTPAPSNASPGPTTGPIGGDGYGANLSVPSSLLISNTSFADVRGFQYDRMDRITNIYRIVNDVVSAQATYYDTNPVTGASYPGLATRTCNALGACEAFSYDQRGMVVGIRDNASNSSTSRVIEYDANGRPTTIESGNGYTGPTDGYSYTYTTDGQIATESEPSRLLASTVISHEYYKDGRQKAIDVLSTALTQNGLFSYSYNADGSLGTYVVNYNHVQGARNPGVATITYGYDSLGRRTSSATALPAASGGYSTSTTALTYQNGNVSSMSYPAPTFTASPAPTSTPIGLLNAFQYNAEGELLGYSGDASAQYMYSTRGELEQNNVFANGVVLPALATTTWDDQMGVPLHSGGISSWTYDAAGRMTKEVLPVGINMASAMTLNRSYDSENHLLATTSNNAPVAVTSPLFTPTPMPLSNSQAWAPIGQPNTIGGTNPAFESAAAPQDTLHWSQGGLLFTTTPDGKVDDLKLDEAAGDVLPQDPHYNGLTMYDRGPEGMGGCFNATTASPYQPNPPFQSSTLNPFSQFSWTVYSQGSPCQRSNGMPTALLTYGSFGSFPTYAPIGQGGTLGMPRSDGFATGTDIIQGVRAFDPNARVWTTPDAMAGFANDPMSQKAYNWNAGNPIANDDPTGLSCETHLPFSNGWSFSPGCGDAPEQVAPDTGADMYQDSLDFGALNGSPIDAGWDMVAKVEHCPTGCMDAPLTGAAKAKCDKALEELRSWAEYMGKGLESVSPNIKDAAGATTYSAPEPLFAESQSAYESRMDGYKVQGAFGFIDMITMYVRLVRLPSDLKGYEAAKTRVNKDCIVALPS